jgi:peroxiredoxin
MKILTAFALFAALAILTLKAQDRDTTNRLNVGDEMPEFTVKTLDGKIVSSEDLYGKIVLINFFATWCGPCNSELPLVESDIWAKYKDRKDFMLLIIDREETADKVAPFVEKKKYTMPFYLDEKRDVYNLFASRFIPRNYLFNKESQLVFNSMGFKKEDFDALKKELDSLLK